MNVAMHWPFHGPTCFKKWQYLRNVAVTWQEATCLWKEVSQERLEGVVAAQNDMISHFVIKNKSAPQWGADSVRMSSVCRKPQVKSHSQRAPEEEIDNMPKENKTQRHGFWQQWVTQMSSFEPLGDALTEALKEVEERSAWGCSFVIRTKFHRQAAVCRICLT